MIAILLYRVCYIDIVSFKFFCEVQYLSNISGPARNINLHLFYFQYHHGISTFYKYISAHTCFRPERDQLYVSTKWIWTKTNSVGGTNLNENRLGGWDGGSCCHLIAPELPVQFWAWLSVCVEFLTFSLCPGFLWLLWFSPTSWKHASSPLTHIPFKVLSYLASCSWDQLRMHKSLMSNE